MKTTRIATRLGTGALVAALAVGALSGGPASAKGSDGRVEKRGACSSAATWKLKGKHDDGRLEVELEVDSNRNGQRWAVVLTDDGTTVYRGTHTTVAPSGSFSVERRIADRAGADVIVGTATNAATGQRCRGTITV